MKSRTAIALRKRDIDILGHVRHTAFHEYLEEGRGAFFASEAGFVYALVHVEMDFRLEVTWVHEHVAVVMWTEAIGRASFTLAHRVELPDGRVAAEGRTVLVAWDKAGHRPHALSPEQRAFLAG